MHFKICYYIMTLFLLDLVIAKPPWAAVDHSVYQSADKCLACHKIKLPSHKMGEPQIMYDQLPLDPSGKMICFTCHDCIRATCVLRKSSEELCSVCHDCTKGMACLIGTAHLGDSPRISNIVRDCLGCHDGSVGKAVDMPGGHRVDILYPKSKKFESVIDKQIVFVDGRVTCVSCHNPYGSDRARLARSNEGSRLCLTCHRK